jgi:hypothetical protein
MSPRNRGGGRAGCTIGSAVPGSVVAGCGQCRVGGYHPLARPILLVRSLLFSVPRGVTDHSVMLFSFLRSWFLEAQEEAERRKASRAERRRHLDIYLPGTGRGQVRGPVLDKRNTSSAHAWTTTISLDAALS